MVRLQYSAGPLPWPALLAYLARRGTPGLDAVDAAGWTRSTPAGPVRVTWDEGARAVAVEGPPEAEAVTRVLGLDRPWDEPAAWRGDPVLGPRIRRTPGLRPLGSWDPFELCLRTVVGQQVTVAAAGTLMGRIGARADGYDPGRIAEADLSAVGMPGRRVETVRALSRAAAAGTLPWTAPWPELQDVLAGLLGFGPWTLAYLALRLGGDLDAFPETDLGLIRQAGAAGPKDLLRLAEAWRPYRGWAAAVLWMAPSA